MNCLVFFIGNHPLYNFCDKLSIEESLVNNRHTLGHIILRISLTFIHRIFDYFRPFIISMKTLIEKTSFFPFLLSFRRLIVVECNPKIILTITWMTLIDIDWLLKNLIESFFNIDSSWFLYSTESSYAFFRNLKKIQLLLGNYVKRKMKQPSEVQCFHV